MPNIISEHDRHVELTEDVLDAAAILDKVSSPKAGATVLFAGTTRDTFEGRAVKSLSYSSYIEKALRTLSGLAKEMQEKHGLVGIAIVHRLGTVPIGETSILVAVSAPHRQAAWRAGEETLEICKETAEIWKKEEFVDGDSAWRANNPPV